MFDTDYAPTLADLLGPGPVTDQDYCPDHGGQFVIEDRIEGGDPWDPPQVRVLELACGCALVLPVVKEV